MSHNAAARSAGTGLGAYRYQRHQPEQTLLYQIIEQHYPVFTAHLADQGTVLPGYVQREFEDYLKCGRLEHGFLRVRCDTCHAEHLVAFSWPLLRIPTPAALVIPFTSQTRRLLPQLRRAAHSRKRGLIGRRGFVLGADAAMGAECALPLKVSVCQPSDSPEGQSRLGANGAVAGRAGATARHRKQTYSTDTRETYPSTHVAATLTEAAGDRLA